MTLKHRARLALQKLGIDFTRYPQSNPDYQAFRAFTSTEPDVILDVGANDGGFASQCRKFGFGGAIVSFEPGTRAFLRLTESASKDPLWQAHRLALGEEQAELTLNVAANAGASSSLLPMLAAHEQAAPDTLYVAEERVAVRRLDEWYAANGVGWDRPALKIDTQGFERQVLAGAGDLLESVVSVQLELSLVPLYAGGWLWAEAVGWVQDRGFELVGLTPGFADPRSGRLLQFDGVFIRRGS
jgi:FkbM family methyltransferase